MAGRTSDTRQKKRFIFDGPFTASFANLPVELLDISVVGAQLRHTDGFPLGKESLLTVVVPGTDVSVSLRAKVRWSRLIGRGADGGSLYRSGLVITEERAELSSDLVDQLLRTRYVKFDGESLDKKREADERKAETKMKVRDETTKTSYTAAQQLEQVRRARMYLQNHPEESAKWSNRARYAASRQRTTSYALERFAVWEFLGRAIDLTIIDLAFKID